MMSVHRRVACLLVTLFFTTQLSRSFAKLTSQLTFQKHRPLIQTSVGQSIVLKCKAEGSLSPVLYWEKHGKRIPQDGDQVSVFDKDDEPSYKDNSAVVVKKGSHKAAGNRLKMSSTMSRLYLDCITPEEAGEYTCVAVTANQVLRTTTIVQVDSTESRHSCIEERHRNRFLSEGSARIHMWTVSRMVYEGSTVQLFCRVSGQPEASVIWIDPKENVIKNDNQYQLLRNGDLLISNVKWSDNMGSYKCIAVDKNGGTPDEVSIFLYPRSPEVIDLEVS